jgi:hypothetical protein
VNFEEYLHSKKIDSSAFKNAESDVWESWKKEFEQIHPASFTSQKLYLINPIRRKYQLKAEPQPPLTKPVDAEAPQAAPPIDQTPKPAVKSPVAKPVFRPKPKMN